MASFTMTAKGAGSNFCWRRWSPVPLKWLRWAWSKDSASDGPFSSPDFPLAALGGGGNDVHYQSRCFW